MTLADLVSIESLQDALTLSAARHRRLCPRQVLGVRIGLAGADALGVVEPRDSRRLLAFVETDGCFVDGLEAATGCSIGHRTLRVEDYGKVAATFYEMEGGRAVRVAPHTDVRERAIAYAPEGLPRYQAQLHGYQQMPDEELLDIRVVQMALDIKALIGRPGVRMNCAMCGEEIINGREVVSNGSARCHACANEPYYVRQPTWAG
ncbi:MAG: FmdE family protein [Dehalococcoidia bacterium]